MIFKIIFYFFSFIIFLNAENCIPFGVRLFFGSSYQNKSSSEILKIYFNTPDLCRQSFVFIEQSKKPI